MNKFIIIITVLFIINGCSTQKNNESEITGLKKVQIQTPSVMCNMCVNTIQKTLLSNDAIKSVEVDLNRKLTFVEYLNESINADSIKNLISQAGYDADDIPRNRDSYNQLPACCKDGK